MNIHPYVGFEGNCREAMQFYAELLGGEIVAMLPYEGTPMAEEMPAELRSLIIHACLKVGDQTIMGADAPPQHRAKRQGMSVMLEVAEPAEAERIFAALAAGGEQRMPLQETFWAQRFGMVVDRFGTPWMVNCIKPQ